MGPYPVHSPDSPPAIPATKIYAYNAAGAIQYEGWATSAIATLSLASLCGRSSSTPTTATAGSFGSNGPADRPRGRTSGPTQPRSLTSNRKGRTQMKTILLAFACALAAWGQCGPGQQLAPMPVSGMTCVNTSQVVVGSTALPQANLVAEYLLNEGDGRLRLQLRLPPQPNYNLVGPVEQQFAAGSTVWATVGMTAHGWVRGQSERRLCGVATAGDVHGRISRRVYHGRDVRRRAGSTP